MSSPLFDLLHKFVEDEWLKLDRQQITPWAFLTDGPPFHVKDFYAHSISYKGILFEGSPRQVFWNRYIEPFLEDLGLRTLDEALRLSANRRQDPRLPLEEATGLLKSVVRRAFARMADIDRRLRGHGFPSSVPIMNVEGHIASVERFMSDRLKAELQMLGDPATIPATIGARTRVFLSYAHADEPWRKHVAQQLGVLEKQGLLDLWDDRKICAGKDWYTELHAEMSSARVAILLISSAFLTSDFILREEVPKLFDKHHEGGMTLFPLVVKPCAWQEVPWLAGLQLRPPEGKAVSLLRGAKRDEALSIVAREVAAICKSPAINSNVSAAGA